jgi:FMN phosphatase YigB (HAD superfamily)
MIEAVILSVRGVLVPEAKLREAAIEAAANALATQGVPARPFRRVAAERLARFGPRALVSRTLRDLGLRVDARAARRAVIAARSACPRLHPDPSIRALLGQFAATYRLALLDEGPVPALESCLLDLGIGNLVERRVWTEQLGRDAAPPSAFAFRWLLQRCDLRPRECLCVAGSPRLRQAARAAGCRSWPPVDPGSESAGGAADLECLLETLDAGGGPTWMS